MFNEKMFDLLYKEAYKAYKQGEVPVSAIIINKEGKVIASAMNRRQKKNKVIGHAEIEAIIKAEKKVKDWRLNGYSMLVSLEPCDMCSVVINESRLDKVFYLLDNKNCSHMFEGNFEVLEGYEEYKKKFNDLLTVFFNNMR